MAKNEDRFVRTYTQGVMSVLEIWVDRQTGVNYLFRTNGSAAGLTVMLDRDGNPVATTVDPEEK